VLFFNKLSLNYRNFSFGANYRYISKIKSIDDRLKIEIKDATMAVDAHITDCYIAYKFKPNNKNTFIPFKVSLNCDNLFDYYYTDMVGNLAMTRKVKLLLEFDVF